MKMQDEQFLFKQFDKHAMTGDFHFGDIRLRERLVKYLILICEKWNSIVENTKIEKWMVLKTRVNLLSTLNIKLNGGFLIMAADDIF